MSNYFAKLSLIVKINPSWSNEKRLCSEIWTYNKLNGKGEDQGWIHGPRQILTPDNSKYISALMINLPKAGYEHVEPSKIERPMRLQIVHNPHATSPLYKKLFDDPADEHYGLFRGQWVNYRTKEPVIISEYPTLRICWYFYTTL